MAENAQTEDQNFLIPMTIRQLFRVMITGAVVGGLTWGLAMLLDMYIFKGMACRGTESMQCAASLQYASISASILGGGVGLFLLARFQVFRSLLVVIAATASMWGAIVALQAQGWQVVLPVSILLTMVAYGLFAWVARLRSFILALVISAVLVVATRFVMSL